MVRLLAGCSILALSAALLVATPAVAVQQDTAAGATAQPSLIEPAGHPAPASKSSAKPARKDTGPRLVKQSTTRNKVAAQGRTETRKASRLGRSERPMVVHGPLDGRIIGPGVTTNCVRFVQMNSDFSLTGKGYTWWYEAEGRYQRAHQPQPGAVMVFKRTGKMPSGHVALVREVLDSRHILIDHSNWSAGHGGRVDLAVKVVDVSLFNDWSQVQVWYGPIQELGTGVYPVHGFVLPEPSFSNRVAQAPQSDW